MGLTRVPKTVAATLTHTFYVGETATDPTGTPACAIVDANGDAVQSGNATIAGNNTGRVTFALSAQSQLAALTATWTATVAGVSVVEVDDVEIVGGVFFTLAEGRASDASLADTTKYTTADLTAAWLEVEQECEQICDRAFVPRYRRAVLDGSGGTHLMLADPEWLSMQRSVGDVRTIRSVKVAPRADETFVALTASQLAAVQVSADGQLRRVDGGIFTEGVANVVVEYEYGLSRPPTDLKRVCMTRLRSRLNLARSAIPDRATSFTMGEGGTFRLDLPGAFKVGIPDVDAVYSRYSRRSGAGTGTTGRAVPASRTLTFQPQRNSLFHTNAGR